jgi:hypothetical protein
LFRFCLELANLRQRKKKCIAFCLSIHVIEEIFLKNFKGITILKFFFNTTEKALCAAQPILLVVTRPFKVQAAQAQLFNVLQTLDFAMKALDIKYES